MKKILLAGSTGFIGKHLISYLTENGYELSVLTRRRLKDTPNVKYFQWDVEKGFIDDKAFENVDTIINLTGANIGVKRWIEKRKKEIVNSRVDSINLLYDYVSKDHYPIKSFISASATGYYGAVTTDQIFTEESKSGNDFLASVSQKWEDTARQFENIGCRLVILRQGVVLGKDSGIYQKMTSLASKGINPAVGNGKQYLPWIDVRDLVRLYAFALENEVIKGVFNAVSSEQITMNEFAQKLSKSIDKNSILPNAPSFLVRLALGEMSSMVLEGSRVSNQKIKESDFTFLYDNLEKSLQ
ncbi:TIGR01777 family oxidoreductase [Arachidicoccus ginsenosidivorans]|uniref:TIGR01777 family protein n=1 Tax=Arachidicoccus ginsenosidivorans TaxID=496057 RepID=A0A5B8VQI2_9BACT|nr:TIGR01777 family oxidoreductase [Arachidicoccus ginsenosidivorans]QEC73877.1 TIGR01777 family protein [Arachidicoccus ginsenosidivorans]